MKKLLSFAVIFALVFTLSIPAFGNEDDTLPAGSYWVDVTGGTADVAYARPGDVVTVTLDPAQIPVGKRFMIWQLGKLIEVPKTATTSSGTLAKTDGTALQLAGLNLAATTSPFVNNTTLSSQTVQFIMPAATRAGTGTPAGTINNYPDDTLWISALYDTVAMPTDDAYETWAMSKLLYEQTGVRLRGTPNEQKAAALIAEKFRSYGYTDVVHYEPRFMNASNQDSGTGPTAGRVIFSEASKLGDMLGNPNPANANVATTGKLVDLGTWTSSVTNLTVPDGLTGDVVAAVRFYPAATAANLNTIKTTFEAANPDLRITGFVWCRSGGTYSNQMAAPSALALTGSLPNIAMPLHNLNQVVKNAEHFESFGYLPASNTTNVVVAKKPAATDDPDLIIVLTAHMDTVLAATGASDNGSGVSVVVGLADYFKDKDLGNIEVWFCPNGSEEGNSMSGARYIVSRLMTAEQRSKAINFNFDMVGTPSYYAGTSWGMAGAPLDCVTLDPDPQSRTYGYPQSLNLPSFLASDRAKSFEWAPGINNIRFNQVGGVDGARFAAEGVDSVNLLVVTNFDDALEFEYHTGGDNFFDNLSYDRMAMVFNLVKNGILQAAENQVTRLVKFAIDEDEGLITLLYADRFFGTFDRLEATIGGQKVIFSKDDPIPGTQSIPASVTNPYNVTLALGYGIGIADHANPLRNVALGLAPTATRLGLNGVRLPLNTLLSQMTPSTYSFEVTPPTCLDDGYTTYFNATKTFVDDIVPALGHDYEGVVTDPTCLDDGFTTYTCQREGCGDVQVNMNEGDVVPALGHNYVRHSLAFKASAAVGTWTNTCDRCNDEYITNVSVSASVEKIQGNQNALTIVVVETLDGEPIDTVRKVLMINNNAAGTYAADVYKVYVDTKGNDQIRACYFVK